jgi:hypothetical protein
LGKDVEAVALVDAEVVFFVVEGDVWPFAALGVKESVVHGAEHRLKSVPH